MIIGADMRCPLVLVLFAILTTVGSGQIQISGNDLLKRDTGSGAGEAKPLECTSEFDNRTPKHTMCYEDDRRVTRVGVSEEEKKHIVDFHNLFRSKTNPPATDLFKLVWDDRLAAVAAKWAKQCKLEHDKNREIPSYGLYIGQNLAAGQRNWTYAMKGWHDEVKLFRYGKRVEEYLGPNGFLDIGHYTQFVNNVTVRIGCGFASCRHSYYGRYYVCNYARGQSNVETPYTAGRQCSACPDTCKNGLCDCKGKMCLNHGRLDYNTCQCKCLAIYSGPECAKLTCPERDPFYCGRSLIKADCLKFSNLPHLCPMMCGICKGKKGRISTSASKVQPSQARVQTPPPEFKSSFGCTYRGARPSAAECKKFGHDGQDTRFCKTKGGDFDCGSCEQFYNVGRDYCPVMCGLCDGNTSAPCGGKKCLNDGDLDSNACNCTCKKYFTGDTCEQRSRLTLQEIAFILSARTPADIAKAWRILRTLTECAQDVSTGLVRIIDLIFVKRIQMCQTIVPISAESASSGAVTVGTTPNNGGNIDDLDDDDLSNYDLLELNVHQFEINP